jgi:hypothetical protein
MSWWRGWWQKTELEADRALTPPEALPAGAADRLERAFASELTSSMSLNIRGTALGAASAIAVLMLAQFSAIWLDDHSWQLPDLWDTAMLVLLSVTVVAFGLASLVAGVAVWPKRRWATKQRDRVQILASGDDAANAALLVSMVESQRRVNERRSRLLRVTAVFFGLALIGTIAQGAIFALVAEPVDLAQCDEPADDVPSPSSLPSPDEQMRLARQYAPRVWLHPGEQFGPLDPTAFISASLLGWLPRRGPRVEVEARGRVSAERLGAGCRDVPSDCYEHDGCLALNFTRPFTSHPARPSGLERRRGFFLDVADRDRRGQARRNPDAPVFFEFRRTPSRLLVTYWFFYGYSRPHVAANLRGADVLRDRLSHEGDWENVEVALSADGSKPLALFLYGHGRPDRKEWKDVQEAAGHPIVYSALDSHASYAAPGRVEVCNPLGCAVDISAEKFRWDTWARDDGLRPVREQPWYGFGGAWGAAGPVGDRTGPLGPSPWKLPADPDPGDLAAVPH